MRVVDAATQCENALCLHAFCVRTHTHTTNTRAHDARTVRTCAQARQGAPAPNPTPQMPNEHATPRTRTVSGVASPQATHAALRAAACFGQAAAAAQHAAAGTRLSQRTRQQIASTLRCSLAAPAHPRKERASVRHKRARAASSKHDACARPGRQGSACQGRIVRVQRAPPPLLSSWCMP